MLDIIRKQCANRPGLLLAVVVITVFSSGYGLSQTTAGLTQEFENPTTSTLPLGTQFYHVQSEAVTTLPLVSVVADETSATVGPVTVRPEKMPAQLVVTPLSGDVSTSPSMSDAGDAVEPAAASATPSLPVKVDKSSTAALALQLARFERQHHVGEAYLLATQLMRENPDEVFGYDVAIRMSLVLGLVSDVEKIHQQAIRKFPSHGKYYVQLAHLYNRAGKQDSLSTLISDLEKKQESWPEGKLTLTLARVRALAEGSETTPTLTTEIPFSLQRHKAVALVEAGKTTAAVELLAAASQTDLTRWEARALTLELANFAEAPIEATLEAMRRTLANEVHYEPAKLLVDSVLNELMRTRKIDELLNLVTARATSGQLSDAEAFVGARLTEMLNDNSGALYFVSPERSGETPLVAFERARLYSNAERTSEAIAILTNLLAEQPTDVPTRLLLGQQQANSRDNTAVMQTLAPFSLASLDATQRRTFVALQTSAILHQRDANQLVTRWAEYGSVLPWTDMQLMGDIAVQNWNAVPYWDEVTSQALARLEDPDNAWPLYGLLARISGVERDSQAELDYYRRLIDYDSENVSLLRFVAELATQHSSVALTLGGGDNGLGAITIHANDAGGTSFAMQLYQRLIELQPGVAENYSALMRVYQANGEVETAKRVALELADRGSSTSAACLAAAGVLEENGLTTDSLGFYRAAVTGEPENYTAWMRYAGALRMTGKYRESEIIYRRILESGYYGAPWNQPAIFANLLAIAYDTDRVEDLVEYLDSLRARDIPGKPEFYLSAAKLMMQVQYSRLADTFLREFRIAFPESRLVPEALLLLGQLQYTTNDLEDAHATFMQIADEFSTSTASVIAMFNAGEILRQTGKAQDAIELWGELARRFPEDDKALSALYEASLTAWTEQRDPRRAMELMGQFVSSGSLDQRLLKQANASLKRMAAGEPPIVE